MQALRPKQGNVAHTLRILQRLLHTPLLLHALFLQSSLLLRLFTPMPRCARFTERVHVAIISHGLAFVSHSTPPVPAHVQDVVVKFALPRVFIVFSVLVRMMLQYADLPLGFFQKLLQIVQNAQGIVEFLGRE
jgi:hypothetical protein